MTPRTDQKQKEVANQKLSVQIHYAWKHARELELENARMRTSLGRFIRWAYAFGVGWSVLAKQESEAISEALRHEQ